MKSTAKTRWVLLVACVIIVTRITTLFTPLIDDEEAFVAFARVLVHGGLPYLSVLDNKPPLIYYWYALWLWVFGDANMIAVHIAAMVWVGLTCLVIYKIGKKAASETAGFFAALCYAIFTTTFMPTYIAAHATLIAALPLSLSVLFLVKWNTRGRLGWLFLSGVCACLSVFVRYQALVQVPFLVCAIALLSLRGSTRLSLRATEGSEAIPLSPRDCFACARNDSQAVARNDSLIASLFLFLLGIAFVAAVVLGALHLQGTLIPFYEGTWKSSLAYIKAGEGVGAYWGRAFSRVGIYVLATFFLWIAVFKQLKDREGMAKPYFLVIIGWFLFTLPAISTGGRFYGHYFIQILPPACLLGGAALSRWWMEGRRKLVAIPLAVLTVGFLIPRIAYQPIAERYGLHNLKVEEKIGAYLRERMPEDSKLFVWGVDPSIYYFSRRDPGTRFLWADSLVGRQPGMKEFQKGGADTSAFINKGDWELFMADMQKNRPMYIVDCASGNLRDYGKFPISGYSRFWEYLKENYEKETSIEGVDVYRIGPGQ